jgi:hypothetical protein
MLLAFPLKFGGICSADMAGMMLTQAPECNHLRGDDAGRAAHRNACRQPPHRETIVAAR